ncbi:uncharacterized protein LOC113847907 isoform X2 [Abrus precatorius]|uniref:Uncharacterized protein LOC113847907 isoform X2 n=1 Tax=Abrus precatorius TaxID=3816 RepID=A0A8B8JNK6_ABRPR|nr:uncharacterized protein LOC113847907 isoform X2 [Abrus precatorius]
MKEKRESEMVRAEPPLVLGLQPSALVDHVARVDWSLLRQIHGQHGGSIPVTVGELEDIVSKVKKHVLPFPESDDDSVSTSPVETMAGGSVANTIRGLSSAFGISTGIIGACGDDDEGHLFVHNMKFNGVDLSRLRNQRGHTAQCVCLVDASGNRTMRPCLSSAVKVHAEELTKDDFKGSKMVRDFKQPLLKLLVSGNIDLCFANEDEATELLRDEQDADPEAAVEFLAKYCQRAVVTLGPKGCIAKHGKEIVRVPAIGEEKACDATGAGDLFASGFMYGLIKGVSLEECCKVGACSGGSVICSLGGEVTLKNRQWMYKQMQIKGLRTPDTSK